MNSLESDILNQIKYSNLIYYGPVYTATGYGSASRYYLIGLIKAGVRVKVIPFGLSEKNNISKDEVRILEKAEKTKLNPKLKNIVILHTTPSGWKNITVNGADYIIGMTIFEPDGLPSQWVKICNEPWINEIWLPSRFNIKTFSKSGVYKNKLSLIHYCIDTVNYKPTNTRNKNKKFRFTYIADFGQRKNLPLLLNAFCEEFKPNDAVELFIQTTSNSKGLIENFINSNSGLLKNRGNIIINTTKMSGSEIINLIGTSNVYVSVDKANGWGMPCMEAMALETLTATVNWSGSTEFMFKSNSLLIEPSGIETVDSESALNQPYYIGQKWATVSIKAVRNVLRKAYAEWDELEDIRKTGRKDVVSMLDTKVVVKEMIDKLNNINVKKHNSKPFVLYRDHIKMVINQIRILTNVQLSYFKTYKYLRLTRKILSKWLHLKPIFY